MISKWPIHRISLIIDSWLTFNLYSVTYSLVHREFGLNIRYRGVIYLSCLTNKMKVAILSILRVTFSEQTKTCTYMTSIIARCPKLELTTIQMMLTITIWHPTQFNLTSRLRSIRLSTNWERQDRKHTWNILMSFSSITSNCSRVPFSRVCFIT